MKMTFEKISRLPAGAKVLAGMPAAATSPGDASGAAAGIEIYLDPRVFDTFYPGNLAPVAITPPSAATGALFQNSSSRAPRRWLAAVCSFLKSFDFKRALIDVAAVFALAAFLIVTALAVLGSFFILFFVALS
jgi:hypothetical protein